MLNYCMVAADGSSLAFSSCDPERNVITTTYYLDSACSQFERDQDMSLKYSTCSQQDDDDDAFDNYETAMCSSMPVLSSM